MKFRYLEKIEISGYGDVETVVREQAMKAATTAACSNTTVQSNIQLEIEVKTRTYKTAVRHILTVIAEAGLETSKKKPGNNENESCAQKSWQDTYGSEKEGANQKIDNINEWMQQRKIKWDAHISRMNNNGIVEITRDLSPIGRRSIGRTHNGQSDNPAIN